VADGGTLFLDEINDMPLETQAKIVRVLQEREVERVGGNRTIEVDVRILAATNQDLEAKVRERSFREDLYYRLNVVAVALPPLRERPEDLPLLIEHFSHAVAARLAPPPPTRPPNARARSGRRSSGRSSASSARSSPTRSPATTATCPRPRTRWGCTASTSR
jgi:transcriptional regulator with GAF, ATPase, and Fis domain